MPRRLGTRSVPAKQKQHPKTKRTQPRTRRCLFEANTLARRRHSRAPARLQWYPNRSVEVGRMKGEKEV